MNHSLYQWWRERRMADRESSCWEYAMHGTKNRGISIDCTDRIDPIVESYSFQSLQCITHLSLLSLVHSPFLFPPFIPTHRFQNNQAIIDLISFIHDSNKHHFTKEFLWNNPTLLLLLLLLSGGSDLRMNQSACIIQQLLQLSRLVQISHDIASTNKFSLN